jgi:hypothetical protein
VLSTRFKSRAARRTTERLSVSTGDYGRGTASAVSCPDTDPLSYYDLLMKNTETSRSQRSQSSRKDDVLIATTGGVIGSLLTVIIVHLIAGPVIKATRGSQPRSVLADDDGRSRETAVPRPNINATFIDVDKLPDTEKLSATLINDLLTTNTETRAGVPPPPPPPPRPSTGKDLLVATTGQVFGSLLTVIIIYLVLVAGSVIKGSTLIIGTIIICLAMFLLMAVFGFSLWAVGSFSNNYTQSVTGKRALLLLSPALLVIVPSVAGLLFLLYLAIKANGS